VDVNEVGKVRLTDALLRGILHVSLDAQTHRRTDAFYQHPYRLDEVTMVTSFVL